MTVGIGQGSCRLCYRVSNCSKCKCKNLFFQIIKEVILMFKMIGSRDIIFFPEQDGGNCQVL